MNNFKYPHLLSKIQSALIQYDEKQKNKKSYNKYALGIYFQALEGWQNDPATIVNPLENLKNYFLTFKDEGKEFIIKDLNKVLIEFRDLAPS